MQSLETKESIFLTTALLVGGFIFLYLNFFCFPAIPVHFFSDHSTYLFNAKRMVDGQMVYRDFFQHSLPATEVLFFVFFSLLGIHAWIPNAVLLLLGLGLAWLILLISRKIIPGRSAYLPAALFLVIAYQSKPGAADAWFSILMVLGAILLVIDHITALGLVGAGAFCGLATCFSQCLGISAEIGLAAFLVWAAMTRVFTWEDCRRAQTYLWIPFITMVVLFNAYFAFEAGIGRFLSDTVAFGFRYWSAAPWNSHHAYMTDLPHMHPWFRVPGLVAALAVYLLVPLVYLLFFVRSRDEKEYLPEEPWDRLTVLWFAGLAIFLGTVTAPTWARLCAVSAPALVLFVWYFTFEGRLQKTRVASLWILALFLAVGMTTESKLQWKGYATTPAGKVALLDHTRYEELNFLLGKTSPGEYAFGSSSLGFLLNLRAPARVPSVTGSDYTRPQQVASVVKGLSTYPVRYVLWPTALALPQGNSDHLGPLYTYLHSNYHVVKIFTNADVLWEKGPQPQVQPATPPPAPPLPAIYKPIPLP